MDDYEKCFICKRNRHAGRLEHHHIFAGARRKLSTRYNLTVTLCPDCHRNAEWAVHRSAETMMLLHKYGQKKAMEEQEWSVEQFVSVFGKNYLEE